MGDVGEVDVAILEETLSQLQHKVWRSRCIEISNIQISWAFEGIEDVKSDGPTVTSASIGVRNVRCTEPLDDFTVRVPGHVNSHAPGYLMVGFCADFAVGPFDALSSDALWYTLCPRYGMRVGSLRAQDLTVQLPSWRERINLIYDDDDC